MVNNESDHKLNCSLWTPKLKKKHKFMGVIFCHGNCGNKLNVFEILELLLESNICAIAFDFSG